MIRIRGHGFGWSWDGPWVWRFYRHMPHHAHECHSVIIFAGPLTFWSKPHPDHD